MSENSVVVDERFFPYSSFCFDQLAYTLEYPKTRLVVIFTFDFNERGKSFN
jgi:hypothetical protein